MVRFDDPNDLPEEDDPLDRTVRLPPNDCSLARTVQQGRDMMFAQLAGVDMTEANFYWAMFHDAVLEGAILARCDLRGATFNDANLRRADLRGANCGLDNLGGSTDFIGADLSGADLRQANIGGADFTNAKLVGADLSGANAVSELPNWRLTWFRGADLTGVRLAGARLSGATYDDRTVFPRGFNPNEAGMILFIGR
ncbi:protein of unknown function [Bradyrhizobium vignae]|uniref:Pentapeptide repeat-containing protein n=2 Tax=Nitrobacteraceae TaxID=41294 RepID=A0A2U3QBR5_9BRAD|nr:protein of unknown function [Bradyrhizobium vignae]